MPSSLPFQVTATSLQRRAWVDPWPSSMPSSASPCSWSCWPIWASYSRAASSSCGCMCDGCTTRAPAAGYGSSSRSGAPWQASIRCTTWPSAGRACSSATLRQRTTRSRRRMPRPQDRWAPRTRRHPRRRTQRPSRWTTSSICQCRWPRCCSLRTSS